AAESPRDSALLSSSPAPPPYPQSATDGSGRQIIRANVESPAPLTRMIRAMTVLARNILFFILRTFDSVSSCPTFSCSVFCQLENVGQEDIARSVLNWSRHSPRRATAGSTLIARRAGM